MRLPKGYSTRPAKLADAPSVADLINAESTSVLGKVTTAEDEVRREWLLPTLDLSRDTRIIVAPGTTVVGLAEVSNRSPYVSPFARVSVDPAHVCRGLGSALAAWTELHARSSIHMAPPDARVAIAQEIWASHTEALELLEARGYAATRYFSRLKMSLESVPSRPDLASGVVIRPFRGIGELPQLVQAEADAFRDHWGFVKMPFEDELAEWQAWIEAGGRHDPALWLVATSGDTIVGMALADGQMNEDPEMAYVSDLGVVRRWRGRGLGTALLISLLDVLRDQGFKRAALDVDAESLTGATRLYDRVGFRLMRQSVSMELELRSGRDMRTQTAPPNSRGASHA
jgi:mycothiol synthase